jgi:transposase-like protein
MAKNKVQFQKGYSLAAFIADYGTEDQCQQALFQWKWSSGFCCPQCGHTQAHRIKTRQLYQCKQCRHQTSLTANTIFASTKLPLTTWFLAIYLLTQSKSGVSALSLMRQLGVSYCTAWMVKQKLMQVMKEREDKKRLKGLIQLDDAYWGGQRHGGKRGRGSPGKTPFVAAVEVSEDGRPIAMKFKVVNAFRAHTIECWAKQSLEPGTYVVSDGLACFKAVTKTGCKHHSIVTGGGHESMTLEAFTWVNTMIGNVKNAATGTYHAVSGKHLPRYLAEFNYRFNRRYDLAAMLPRLGYVAARTPPMPGRLLKLAGAC